MSVDFETIFQKYNIPTAQSGRHKRQGYSNVVCPFCTGSDGMHRGFCQETGHSTCYRCGFSPTPKALSAVLRIDFDKAQQLINQHTTGFIKSSYQGFCSEVNVCDTKSLNIRDMVKFHRLYLEKRGFNVDRLIHFFNLKSTGTETNPFYYKNKIFIPFYLNNELVTYSTRDISVDTKQSGMRSKYITCKKQQSVLPPNYFIYNFDNIRHRKNKRTLFFEGCADVWKFPTCAGALSGVKFPPAQVKFIVDNFNFPVFLLDCDDAGDKGAQKAFDEIEVLTGRTPEVYELDGSLKNSDGSLKDPGDFTYSEVEDLLKQLDIQV